MVAIPCVMCGVAVEVDLTAEQWNRWRPDAISTTQHGHVTEDFPQLMPEEHDLIAFGYCGPCMAIELARTHLFPTVTSWG